jgi:hypothetical protein
MVRRMERRLTASLERTSYPHIRTICVELPEGAVPAPLPLPVSVPVPVLVLVPVPVLVTVPVPVSVPVPVPVPALFTMHLRSVQ